MLVMVALVAPGPAAAWSWPADGPVLRGFDFGGPEYHEHGHSGIDVGGDAGAAVRAPAAGLVSFAGWLPRNGRTVTIRTPDGYAVTLLHLGTITVSPGDGVAETEPVGTIGPSGDVEVDVPYVHLGIRRADDPKGYVDPLTLLPPRPSPPPAEPGPAPPPAVVSPAPAPAKAPVTGAEAEAQPDERPLAASRVAGPVRTSAPPLRQRSRGVRPSHATRPARSGAEPPARTGGAPLAAAPRARTSAAPRHRGTARERPLAGSATAVTRPAVPARVAVGRTVVQPPDPQPSEPTPTRARVGSSAERPSWILAAAALLALLGAAVLRRGRPGEQNAARKMTAPEPSVDGALDDSTPTDPRRPSVAVCERSTSHRPFGGVRSAGGRVRPLSPSPRQSGPHGQRDGRARDADHGRGRPGRALVP
jgi:Peptidase family M23